jgi:hypothetical protein
MAIETKIAYTGNKKLQVPTQGVKTQGSGAVHVP